VAGLLATAGLLPQAALAAWPKAPGADYPEELGATPQRVCPGRHAQMPIG